jgi:hypothetical protein
MSGTEKNEKTAIFYYCMVSSKKDITISYSFSKGMDVPEVRVLPEVSAKFYRQDYLRLWQLASTLWRSLDAILKEAKEQN